MKLLPGMSEAEFQKQVVELARMCGWRVAWCRNVRIQRKDGSTHYEAPLGADGKGFLDLLLIHEKRRLLIVAELKVPPNKTTPEQDAWIAAWNAVNVYVRVWVPDMWPEIEELLTGSEQT